MTAVAPRNSAGTVQQLSSVDAGDLLGGRPDVVHSREARLLVGARRILVTGAGGSIGSELVRQLWQLSPASIHLVDHDESALHAIQLDLHGHGLLDDDTVVLGDIRQADAMRELMARVRPHIVFHAAAHKHLPLLQRYPAQGVLSNVIGTANVVRAAAEAGVDRFIFVSTDKAARPTSVLGLTKRLGEVIVQAYAGGSMRVGSVRFGNVIGSRGSFLHSLAWQVGNGRPVTLTSPDVTRFFMTIPQASSLVIEAATMATAGETYILDMGQPVRIADLVDRYVAAVQAPGVEITYTGLREGEKLHEELLDEKTEQRESTADPRIWCVRPRTAVRPDLLRRVEELGSLVGTVESELLVAAMSNLLPDAESEDASSLETRP
ncbi:polysaccharide biosynthesis protein [Streptomyces collinus]